MADKDFLDLLIKSQDKISDRLDAIERIQVSQESNLKEHIYRTELNEKAIAILSEAIQPVQKHVTQVETVLKIAGLIGSGIVALGGLVLGIIEFLKRI